MALEKLDFDFLAWLERILCVPTFYNDLLKMGVERDVALAFSYSDAIRKKHSVIALYQAYGLEDDEYGHGFMTYINYRRAEYDAIKAKEEHPVIHTVLQAPFVMEDLPEEFIFT